MKLFIELFCVLVFSWFLANHFPLRLLVEERFASLTLFSFFVPAISAILVVACELTRVCYGPGSVALAMFILIVFIAYVPGKWHERASQPLVDELRANFTEMNKLLLEYRSSLKQTRELLNSYWDALFSRRKTH